MGENTCRDRNLPPREMCRVGVTFAPTAQGVQTAVLQVAHDRLGSPFSVNLTGTGTAAGSGAIANPDPDSLTFGDQRIGVVSASQRVTVTNDGTAPLEVSAVGLAGAQAADFLVFNDACTNIVVPRQCSIGVNAKDLATMAATLASGGRNPVTGKQVMDAAKVPGVLAVMATAGLYDDSGKWLYATGLPAKSGVGGGLLAVSPGRFGIAVVSPPLDDAGNSVRAQKAIADISNALGGNPYAPKAR